MRHVVRGMLCGHAKAQVQSREAVVQQHQPGSRPRLARTPFRRVTHVTYAACPHDARLLDEAKEVGAEDGDHLVTEVTGVTAATGVIGVTVVTWLTWVTDGTEDADHMGWGNGVTNMTCDECT